MTDQPAFLPDPETGRYQDQTMTLKEREDLARRGFPGMTHIRVWRCHDPDLYICPRTYKPAVSLLDARTERRPFPWLLWIVMALPVAVAAIWRWWL